MADLILEIKNLYKSYFKDSIEISVLKNINLKIYMKDNIAITGKSGSGKSTLLNLIGTLDLPTQGKIFFKNTDITKLKEDDLAKFRNKYIGFVFQFHYLIKELTALENVILPALISGKKYYEIIEHAEYLLNKLEIYDRKDHKPSEMSGGEQQRVAIARALINKPNLLLADEPTGNLDSKTSMKILELLHNLQEEFNLTFVIATHNNDIAQTCERRIRLIDGNIEEIF